MFQILLGRSSRQSYGPLKNRLQWPTPNRSDRPQSDGIHVPPHSLRYQGAAWATAGGGIFATLGGVYRMLRGFRQLRYI
ncbi:hypothetical protein BDV59DRAFT_167832 [Aspergillus ambiguus]|uniref:uncharacterized protein n=1 Tax=Aspergillus ambiguus TaxID=176160 RepID=UPI003CCDF015